MEHFNAGWTEQNPDQKSRLWVFVIIVLGIMILVASILIGADGLLRMFGLKDDALKLELNVQAFPDDAQLYMNNSLIDNPASFSVSWLRGSQHTFEAYHPEYISDNLIVQVPVATDVMPQLIYDSQNISTDLSSELLKITFNLQPEYLTLSVVSEPPGAAISIDGIQTNHRTPMDYAFKTGDTVTITATLDGHKTATKEFQIPLQSSDTIIAINLERDATPVPSRPTQTPVPTGTLRVSSEFPLDVYTGSRRIVNQRRQADVTLNAGRHNLRFVNRGYLLDHEMTVTISANRVYPVTMDSPGKVHLESIPTGADVMVDGYKLGNTPGTFSLYPGLYNVSFIFETCDDVQSIWVRVVSGQTRRIPAVRGCQ